MKNPSKNNSEHIQTRLFPKRIDKTLDWLEASRDVWKEKCLAAKLELKMKTLSVKRLRDGRDRWKHQTKQASTVIQQMENKCEGYLKEIEKFKKELIRKNSEVENLKKKS